MNGCERIVNYLTAIAEEISAAMKLAFFLLGLLCGCVFLVYMALMIRIYRILNTKINCSHFYILAALLYFIFFDV
jgi:hypothetical protein